MISCVDKSLLSFSFYNKKPVGNYVFNRHSLLNLAACHYEFAVYCLVWLPRWRQRSGKQISERLGKDLWVFNKRMLKKRTIVFPIVLWKSAIRRTVDWQTWSKQKFSDEQWIFQLLLLFWLMGGKGEPPWAKFEASRFKLSSPMCLIQDVRKWSVSGFVLLTVCPVHAPSAGF